MTDIKVYRVDITVSEYNANDEGFYIIKDNTEVVKDPKYVIKTLESVYFNTLKYLEKRLK